MLSANGSYQRASEDIKVLTGMTVSASTQQRLVHHQDFEPPRVEAVVDEMSIDGGKVRLRTPLGEKCEWRDYKAVNLHEQSVNAFFQDNNSLVNWVNQQPLAVPLTCLGDGHGELSTTTTIIQKASQLVQGRSNRRLSKSGGG